MPHNGRENPESVAEPARKLKEKHYLRELKKLHVEIVKLQEWVKHQGLKVCIVFEGRDGAGKGGTIKAITERVSPRVFHFVAQIYLLDNPLLSEPLKREHIKPRLPEHRPGHDRHAETVQAVQLSWRHPQSRRARNAGQHPRRWRVGLRIESRLRRRVRQPGPDRRVRRRQRRSCFAISSSPTFVTTPSRFPAPARLLPGVVMEGEDDRLVDVVTAFQTMIGYREETVRIRIGCRNSAPRRRISNRRSITS